MGISQVAKSLYTPDGEVPLRERDVIPLSIREVQMLATLHEWAQKYQITITCKRCNGAIMGRNNDAPENRTVSVECLCRQWRFDRR